MFEPLIDYLKEKQVGLIQMPCIELYVLGLGRFDVRVGMESPAGMNRLMRLIDDQIFTMREYLFQGFEIVGILGKQGSPSCGVTRTWLDGIKQDETIKWLEERLKEPYDKSSFSASMLI
jgi:predicted secreted protein